MVHIGLRNKISTSGSGVSANLMQFVQKVRLDLRLFHPKP